jgi:hypothetical protein
MTEQQKYLSTFKLLESLKPKSKLEILNNWISWNNTDYSLHVVLFCKSYWDSEKLSIVSFHTTTSFDIHK